MATKFWICYDSSHGKAGYRAPEAEFKHPEEGHECPKCKNCDYSFPWRKFRCLGCGHEEEQGKFFAVPLRGGKLDEAPLDEDPVESKWEYDCSDVNNSVCDSTSYEQIDDSQEPPTCKLFQLRVEKERGEPFFYDYESRKTFAEIRFKLLTLGTRIVVVRGSYSNERSVKEYVVSQENRSGFLAATNDQLEDYDDLRIYLRRATEGEHQNWTPEQWFNYLVKTQTSKKGRK